MTLKKRHEMLGKAGQAYRDHDWEDQHPDATLESNLRRAYKVAADDTLPEALRNALERLRGRMAG